MAGLLRIVLLAAVAMFVTRWLRRMLSARPSGQAQKPTWPGTREGTGATRSKLKVLRFPSDPHEVLGLEPGASDDEIRQAYKDGMAENDPDRVSGMADEIRELALRQQSEIEAAYRQLMGEE